MAKTYPELLGEWVRRRESTKRDKNLVAFLAVRDDVKGALDAGYAVTTIWSHMHDEKRVLFGYDTFLNYVNRHIRRAPKEMVDTAAVKKTTMQPIGMPARTGTKVLQQEVGPKTKAPDAVPGFTYNAAPRMEDLI